MIQILLLSFDQFHFLNEHNQASVHNNTLSTSVIQCDVFKVEMDMSFIFCHKLACDLSSLCLVHCNISSSLYTLTGLS